MDINKFGIENHCGISNSSYMSTDHEYCIINDFPGMFSRLITHIFVLGASQMERIYGMQFPFPDLTGNLSLGFLKLPHMEESYLTAQCCDVSKRGFVFDFSVGKRGLCKRYSRKRERKNIFSAAKFPYTSKIPIKTTFFQIAVHKYRFIFVMITFFIICSTIAL